MSLDSSRRERWQAVALGAESLFFFNLAQRPFCWPLEGLAKRPTAASKHKWIKFQL